MPQSGHIHFFDHKFTTYVKNGLFTKKMWEKSAREPIKTGVCSCGLSQTMHTWLLKNGHTLKRNWLHERQLLISRMR